MKDKRDNKTLELSLAKSNAERQKEFRQRIAQSKNVVRINTFISNKANEKLELVMSECKLSKRDSLNLILESLTPDQISELLKVK